MKTALTERKLGVLGCLVILAAMTACGSNSGNSSSSKCSGLAAGDFIITEFMANPAGTDDFKEYIEIYNPGSVDLSLDGVKIFTSKADGSSQKSNWTIKTGVIKPGEYFTVGDFDDSIQTSNEDAEIPAPYKHLNYYFNKKLGLGGSDSIIGLRCGSVVVDQVSYAKTSEARARILSGDKLTGSADPANWCDIPKDDAYEIEEILSCTYNEDGTEKSCKANYGTPQKANPVCPAGEEVVTVPAGKCLENGTERDIVPPAEGQLLINEILAYAGDDVAQVDEEGNPVLDAGGNPVTKFTANKNYHYVELLAAGTSAFDLNGLKLAKSDKNKWAIEKNACIRINPNDLIVVAKSGDKAANGGINADVVVSKLDMNQSGTLSILKVTGEGDSAKEVEIDSVVYPKTAANTSWQRSGNLSDKDNFCLSTGTYSEKFHGTPGEGNAVCEPKPPKCDSLEENQCCDNGTPRTIVTPSADELVITEIMAYTGDAPGENGNEGTSFKTNKNYQYIEVYSASGVDLNGLTISKNTSSGNWTIENEECVHVKGGYFVIAKNGDSALNGGISPDLVLSKMDLNQSGNLQIIAGKGTSDETVVTEVEYPKTAANTSWQVTKDLSDDLYCESTETYTEKFHGTPGSENSDCPDPNSCLDNGTPRSVVPAALGDLVITELMTNPVGEGSDAKKPAKWFEIKANRTVDMNGVVMKRGTASESITSEQCLRVSEGGYFVVAFSNDSSKNGGLPADVIGYVQSKIDLPYSSAGTLSLESADGTSLATFDYPAWSSSTKVGHAIQFDGANTCAATESYGSAGNYGTPGSANGMCSVE